MISIVKIAIRSSCLIPGQRPHAVDRDVRRRVRDPRNICPVTACASNKKALYLLAVEDADRCLEKGFRGINPLLVKRPAPTEIVRQVGPQPQKFVRSSIPNVDSANKKSPPGLRRAGFMV
jgi:hypothetical protein